MVSYFRNFFLSLLFSQVLLAYSMYVNQYQLDLNCQFLTTAISAYNNDFSCESDLKKIKELLEQGANPNIKIGIEELTPLVFAIQKNRGDFVRLLLQHGADSNIYDKPGWTPLHWAISSLREQPQFDMQIFEDLLQHGANPNAQTKDDFAESSLSWAAQDGYNDLIKSLLKYRADVNQRDGKKNISLAWAINNRHFDVTKKLCNAGASLTNINSDCSNVFHRAIQQKFSKEQIEWFMMYAQLSAYSQQQDEQLKKEVITFLLVFNRFNSSPDFSHYPKLSKDIQLHILSYLAPTSLYGFNKKLCKKLFENDGYLFAYIHKRVAYFQKILQGLNKQRKTALHILHENYQNNEYIQEVGSLLDGSRLRSDWETFEKTSNKESISNNNLALQMYNSTKLLLKTKE